MNDPDEAGCTDRFIVYAAEKHGLKAESVTSRQQLIKALKSGCLIAAAMDPGHFCSYDSTHEILVYGWDHGQVMVRDPYYSSNNHTFSVDTIWKERSFYPGNCLVGGPLFALS